MMAILTADIKLLNLSILSLILWDMRKLIIYIYVYISYNVGLSGGSDNKESACNSGDLGLIPGLEKPPGEGNNYPL